ncbi:flagellar hook-basal body complex protein [Azospirillum sp. sgz301742]
MSVFGSMTTAVTGLAAQARALGSLSDNIANSQTVGYKRVETSFQELVTQSNADLHSPGGVRARPSYTNSVQGNITQTENTTNMAISGNGFFQVSRGTEGTSEVAFQNTPYFTRAGDFSLDRFGYLKNNAGMYLNGWGLNSSGALDKGSISPIRIQQLIDTPTATQNINLSANLPLAPTTANQPTQTVTIIDATGVERQLQLNWRQQGAGNWRLSVNAPGSSSAVTAGTLNSTIDDGTGTGTALTTAIGTPFVAAGGSPATVQSSTVTLNSAVTANTVYTVSVAGQTFSYTATATDVTNPNNVPYQLWSQIQAANAAPGGASVSGNTITLTGDSAGNKFSIASTPAGVPAGTGFDATTGTAAVPGVNEQIFVPVGGPAGNVGDIYKVDFSAIALAPAPAAGWPAITYTTDGTESNATTLAERIAAKINGNSSSPVTATVSGAGIMLAAKTASATSVAPTTLATPGTMPAHVQMQFTGGYLTSMNAANVGTGTAGVPPSQTSGDPAYLDFDVNYGYGAQRVRLNLGQFGSAASGLTQFTGSDIVQNSLSQDGFTRGAFQDLEIKTSGDVVANYDNGRSRVLARVPVIQVTNPDALQKTNGNAYSLTREAGGTRADDASANGAGGLVVSSVEGSNVDIAQEFTKMIVTQRAYSANTKVVTASDEMLQETLGMKR